MLPLLLLTTAQLAPMDLADLKVLHDVCTEVSKRSPVDPDDEEADTKEEQWEKQRKVVFAKVYRAKIDPKAVRFGPFDAAQGELPIVVDRVLPAVDGALLVTVMDREDAAFEAKAEDAKAWAEKAEDKQLSLAITFQIDDQFAEEVSPCFSYQKSETYSLRVFPLRYELLDASGTALASTVTERGDEYAKSLDKKPAVLVSAQVFAGVVDEKGLEKALGEKRTALGACMSKAGETASFGLLANVAGGKISGARVEMEASDDPQASSCLIAAINGTLAPKASKDATVSILVSLD
jgi:hypothetical protein